jgi:4-hydroxy-tetrahydrodipicolinate synthase
VARFHGIIPYLVTPLDAEGRIEAGVMTALCDDLIAAGVHGLTPLGSTGEFAYLDEAQKREAVAAVVAAAGGRVPVLPGVAATAIRGAVAQAKACRAAGADGIVLILDAYFPLTEGEVERYFLSVADATDLPIILYTNPNFQRADLSVASIARLSRHPNIVGIKDASTNTGRLLSILNRVGDDLDVFAASSHIAASVMMLGGKGWFAGPACVIPRECLALYRLCREGNWPEAVALQKRVWAFNEVFARYNLAACVKAALRMQGYAVGDPVPPQSPASPEACAAIAAALAAVTGADASGLPSHH